MIIVCSLNDLTSVCESVKPKFVISVIDPGYAPETPKDVSYHLKLGFDDIVKISSENKIFRLNKDDIPLPITISPDFKLPEKLLVIFDERVRTPSIITPSSLEPDLSNATPLIYGDKFA